MREFAAPRYKEGYEKGFHDHDAVAILRKLIPVGESADLLRFNPHARGIAVLFWEQVQREEQPALWPERARTCTNIYQLFRNDAGLLDLQAEIEAEISLFLERHPIKCEPYQQTQAAEYLSLALSQTGVEFHFSKYARTLLEGLQSELEKAHMWGDFNQSQQNLGQRLARRWMLVENWLNGLCSLQEFAPLKGYISEAVVLVLLEKALNARFSEVDLHFMEEAFTQSYIENSLTSNPVLAPLALRDMHDLYQFIDKAMGKPFSSNGLSYPYSEAEITEIVAILEHLLMMRNIVFKVNQQYIASAAQSDKYRTEPSFKLQGSYRNMNKLSEKVSAVMNAEEIRRIIDDHYLGEAQLLTSGAEENLLKLAEIRGTMTSEEAQRWQQIKRDFMRNKALGGDNADVGDRVVAQLADLVESVQALGSHSKN
ncbi:hypothetical protein [Xenorhabdus lircayensis]|uniref:hypothetical protein n=1 Tax=Xenorhabdus lircayensis TaxID=2763499 RepID=UPI001E4159E9|nr:hypothetical protein [Xenorhabdus lircayensis]